MNLCVYTCFVYLQPFCVTLDFKLFIDSIHILFLLYLLLWFWDFTIKNLQDFIKIYRALIKDIFLIGQISVLPRDVHLFSLLLSGICFLQPIGKQHGTDPVSNLPNQLNRAGIFINYNLMMESCGKSIKIDYSDPIFRRRENVACRCLRACWRRVSEASFVSTLSPVPLRLEGNFRDGSVGLYMYFHLVYSADFFAVASGRKSTRKLFRQATELMVLMHHEFVVNPTSPPFAFLSRPFHMGISLPLGKRLMGHFGTLLDAKNPSQTRAQTLTLCTSEHERK